ncbi:PEP-CTERM sorting domain-containing protein [Massilia horti]|uniref:PEP-CTERM protein-sorting domain-containing protein n=1 Tax=Massilia horti TaxID=2562153 RepID=A0A4Y9T490_9BURK|nr:PEP-CTERM sorting domain-containing protein [Massilia horti]TFW32405.1 hypothetical protein E4O92_09920 [Massilia horti]
MNKYALAAALALALGGAAQAAAIDLSPGIVADSVPTQATQSHAVAPPMAADHLAIFSVDMSELPEPAVFLMMLLGLVLIGYRASRDSSEKFK